MNTYKVIFYDGNVLIVKADSKVEAMKYARQEYIVDNRISQVIEL